jgi:hypothetical protein
VVLPRRTCAQDGIEEGDELPHDGADCDLGRLAGGTKAAVEGGKRRVVAGGDQGGHVEGGADACSAAGHASGAVTFAAVVGEGRDTDQGCDPLAGGLAELWQFSEQAGGGSRSNAGHRPQKLGLLRQDRHVADVLGDLRLELGEPSGEPLDPLRRQALQARQQKGLGLLAGGDEFGLDLAAQDDHLGEGRARWVSRRGRAVEGGGAVRDHPGVDRVGLGPPAAECPFPVRAGARTSVLVP